VHPAIRLYTLASSPYAAKVHCFLLFKGLDFEPIYINVLRGRKALPVGKRVPVLSVGEQSRADSTPIGLWLDELFPDHPRLLPDPGAERDRLLAVDDWISSWLIPGTFRSYPGGGLDGIRNSWLLADATANTAEGGVPAPMRWAWPLFVGRVAFVRRLLAQAKANDPRPEREAKFAAYDAFLDHLAGGPFVAGRQTPSLPDLSAYPQFAFYYALAFRGGDDIRQRAELMAWLERMRPYVDRKPPLLPDAIRVRDLP
jgi:glutathione S-transferase